MPFALQDFRSKVRDLARGYQFEVEIVFPQVVGQSDLVSILCHSHSFPGRTLAATTDTFFMGLQYKLAADLSYPQWTANFRVDDNWDSYKRIKAWQELVHGTESNIASFPSQYKSTINLYQLDVAGNRLVAIQLNGSFPASVEQVALSTENRTVVESSVTWQYDYNKFTVL